jgi:hypothetical protein
LISSRHLLAALLVAVPGPSAGAPAEVLAGDCTLVAKAADGTMHDVLDGARLSEAIAISPVPPLGLPDGYSNGFVICARGDLIPAPNDYKVLLLGYPLLIRVTVADGKQRTGVLEIDDGQLQYTTLKGTDPTGDEIERGEKAVNALQARMDAEPHFKPKSAH